MRRLLFLLAIGIVMARPCGAQQLERCGSYTRLMDALLAAPNDQLDNTARAVADVGQNTYCFAWFVAALSSNNVLFDQFVKRFESSRADKEATGAGASRATSVVAQGPVAKVLSAAVEYGAVTRTVDGQVITLRGNAAGLPSALVRKDVFPYCAPGVTVSEFCVSSSALSILRRISGSVSFDTARGTQVTGTPTTPTSTASAQIVTFAARRNQISAASVHLELWNRRDVASQTFQNEWRVTVGDAMSQSAGDLLQAAGPFAELVKTLAAYPAWETETKDAILAARPDKSRMFAALNVALHGLIARARTEQPDFDRLATDALAAYSRYFLAQNLLLDSLSKKNVLALEYTGSQPVGQVGTSNVRLILDLPLTTRTRMVANGAATFYDSLPANSPADVKRYRDAQFGLELDHGLGEQSILGPATISFALYYQYQHAPALLEIDPLNPIPGIEFAGLAANARTLFTEKGDIWLGQAKLSLTPPGSSIKIPLSLTYSNRTELIDKPTWRGQVGLAYDLDSLLGSLK